MLTRAATSSRSGSVLYELITGKRAFDGNTPASVIASILKEQPQPITQLSPTDPHGDRSRGADLSRERPGQAMAVGARGQTRARLGIAGRARHAGSAGTDEGQHAIVAAVAGCDGAAALAMVGVMVWANRPPAAPDGRAGSFSDRASRRRDVRDLRRALAGWTAAGLYGNRCRRDRPAVVPRSEERGAADVARHRRSAKRLLVARQPTHCVRLPQSTEEDRSVGRTATDIV